MRLGNIQATPWYLRLALFMVIAGAMYGAFYYFVTRGTRAETATLNEEIQVLVAKNAQAQIASQRLNEFRALYEARQEEYDELKALLPEQRELTMVLQGLQDRARNNGLTLRKFTPLEDVQVDNYSGKMIDVNVTSTFASLRAFFEQLAHYQRIVSISKFELKQIDKAVKGHTINATFSLTAYYVSAEKLQKSNAPPPPPPAAK